MPKLFHFENADKDVWNGRDDAKSGVGFRRGSRCISVGNPGTGKSNAVCNKVADSDPAYDLIYIYTVSRVSKEYDKINYIHVNSIQDLPQQEELTSDKKILIILEDMDAIPRKDIPIIDTYLRFSCSHLGVTFCIVCQNFFSILPSFRRKMDVFILHMTNIDSRILKAINIPKEDMDDLVRYFKKNSKNVWDFITVDIAIKDRYIFNNEIILNV